MRELTKLIPSRTLAYNAVIDLTGISYSFIVTVALQRITLSQF